MPRRRPRRAPDQEGTATLPARRQRRPGRTPAVADPTRVAAMLDAIRAGVPVTAACQHSGVSWAAHSRAMDAGQQAEELAEQGHPLTDRQQLYRTYRSDFLCARAATAVVHVALVAQAAQGGKVVKETTRRYRNDDGKAVVETEREYTRPDWRASRFMLQTGAYRDDFVAQTRRALEVTGAGGAPLGQQRAAEEVLHTIAERLASVQKQQRQELPGGWDRPDDDGITDAELVDDEGDVA